MEFESKTASRKTPLSETHERNHVAYPCQLPRDGGGQTRCLGMKKLIAVNTKRTS
jgi:hypothetical protein